MGDVKGKYVVRGNIGAKQEEAWAVMWIPKYAKEEADLYALRATRREARDLARNLNYDEAHRPKPGVFQPTCPDCDSRGWLHMSDSMGRGPGIECCDTCHRCNTDDEAEVAHAQDCLCGMTCAREKEEG